MSITCMTSNITKIFIVILLRMSFVAKQLAVQDRYGHVRCLDPPQLLTSAWTDGTNVKDGNSQVYKNTIVISSPHALAGLLQIRCRLLRYPSCNLVQFPAQATSQSAVILGKALRCQQFFSWVSFTFLNSMSIKNGARPSTNGMQSTYVVSTCTKLYYFQAECNAVSNSGLHFTIWVLDNLIPLDHLLHMMITTNTLQIVNSLRTIIDVLKLQDTRTIGEERNRCAVGTNMINPAPFFFRQIRISPLGLTDIGTRAKWYITGTMVL